MLIQEIEIWRLLSRSYTQTLFRAALVVLILMGLSSPSKAQDTSSSIQLTITDALLSAHCVPASDNSQGLAFQSDSINSHNGMTGSDSQAWVMLRIGRQAVQSHKRKEPVDEENKVCGVGCPC